jgi:hypothetical protein
LIENIPEDELINTLNSIKIRIDKIIEGNEVE